MKHTTVDFIFSTGTISYFVALYRVVFTFSIAEKTFTVFDWNVELKSNNAFV